MSTRYRSLAGKRLAQKPEMTTADLSRDVAYIEAKLATKKSTIRALEAKVRRLESALRSGWTWSEYQQVENERREDARRSMRTEAS